MSGFFSKLFGGKKKSDSENSLGSLVRDTVDGLIEKANFELTYKIKNTVDAKNEPQLYIEFSGKDEGLLKDKEGQMLEAVQLFIKRVIQHNFPDDKTEVIIDCNGFIDESSRVLVELAEKLKGLALEKGKSVYFRALPPKDRKIVHQHLAGDSRVRSRSVGEGLYKKIKIYPVKVSEAGADGNSAD